MIKHIHRNEDLYTDLGLHPGVVSRRADDHLNDGGSSEQQQDSWGNIPPHVVVETVWPETQHVLQVLHKPVKEITQGVDLRQLNPCKNRLSHTDFYHHSPKLCHCTKINCSQYLQQELNQAQLRLAGREKNHLPSDEEGDKFIISVKVLLNIG